MGGRNALADAPLEIPADRLQVRVERPVRPDGAFVVYWMTSARRLTWNYALERAAGLAARLDRPLVVLEALRADYRFASDRHHAFVLGGMADNARRAGSRPILYHPYVEPVAGAGRGLLAELSRRASAIVGDDSASSFLPRMLDAASRQVECRLELVDSNGLLPMRGPEREFPTAYAFRRHLQNHLKRHLLRPPMADPLAGLRLPVSLRLPEAITRRWPAADPRLLAAGSAGLGTLPIDHAVGAVPGFEGGTTAACAVLRQFLDHRLARYADERSHPDADAASGLSPWLHFGHLAPHQVLAELAEREGWVAETLPEGGRGGREGWWGMSRSAESFLDELVTWREVGLNFCFHRPGERESYETLPAWARATLERHAGDRRSWRYSLGELEAAGTHDELWNAAQRQLVEEGRIQNYLRMLWGKKVLEWSASPRAALAILLELNDRYALDGRDPNSLSGIFWCFGRYDRPWAPEREVFGVVRYMSSANTRRKLRLDGWLRRWSSQRALDAPPA